MTSSVRIGSSTNSSMWPPKAAGNDVFSSNSCSVPKLATLPPLQQCLKVWHAARKRIPEVEVDRIIVGAFRRAHRHKPRNPAEPLILTHGVDGTVARIPPKSLVEAESDFI